MASRLRSLASSRAPNSSVKVALMMVMGSASTKTPLYMVPEATTCGGGHEGRARPRREREATIRF